MNMDDNDEAGEKEQIEHGAMELAEFLYEVYKGKKTSREKYDPA